jgi:hypothetical protein
MKMRKSKLVDRDCFMKNPTVFLALFSGFDDRKIEPKVNRACGGRRSFLVALLALGLIAGCSQAPGTSTEKSAAQPVTPAAEHKEAAPAPSQPQPPPQPPAPAPVTPTTPTTAAPAPTPPAIQDLEKKLRPNVPPPPPPPAPDDEAERARAAAALAGWAEKIGTHDETGAGDFLVTEKDLGGIVTEGIRKILSSSLLAKNKKELDTLLEEAQKKEVRLAKWTPENITRTQPGSFYRNPMTSLKGTLELALGGQATTLALDLLLVDGRWKIFKITRPD